MKDGDTQKGFPSVLYTDTQSNIEALTGVAEGAKAYASDVELEGTYLMGNWVWGIPHKQLSLLYFTADEEPPTDQYLISPAPPQSTLKSDNATCYDVAEKYIINTYWSGDYVRGMLPGGLWRFGLYMTVDDASGVSTVLAEVYKENPVGADVLILTAESGEINAVGTPQLYEFEGESDDIVWSTDREPLDLIIKLYGTTDDTGPIVVTFHWSQTYPSYVIPPFNAFDMHTSPAWSQSGQLLQANRPGTAVRIDPPSWGDQLSPMHNYDSTSPRTVLQWRNSYEAPNILFFEKDTDYSPDTRLVRRSPVIDNWTVSCPAATTTTVGTWETSKLHQTYITQEWWRVVAEIAFTANYDHAEVEFEVYKTGPVGGDQLLCEVSFEPASNTKTTYDERIRSSVGTPHSIEEEGRILVKIKVTMDAGYSCNVQVFTGGGGGVVPANNLHYQFLDVQLGTRLNNDLLKFNTTTGRWENATIASLDIVKNSDNPVFHGGGYIELLEASAPSTPSSGYSRLWTNSKGLPFVKTDGGVNVPVGEWHSINLAGAWANGAVFQQVGTASIWGWKFANSASYPKCHWTWNLPPGWGLQSGTKWRAKAVLSNTSTGANHLYLICNYLRVGTFVPSSNTIAINSNAVGPGVAWQVFNINWTLDFNVWLENDAMSMRLQRNDGDPSTGDLYILSLETWIDP